MHQSSIVAWRLEGVCWGCKLNCRLHHLEGVTFLARFANTPDSTAHVPFIVSSLPHIGFKWLHDIMYINYASHALTLSYHCVMTCARAHVDPIISGRSTPAANAIRSLVSPKGCPINRMHHDTTWSLCVRIQVVISHSYHLYTSRGICIYIYMYIYIYVYVYSLRC